MWDLIVSVPDHCLSFYFAIAGANNDDYIDGDNSDRSN